MYLIAQGLYGLAIWGSVQREETQAWHFSAKQIESCCTPSFSQEAQFYENARTENANADLYRQMDPEDFIFVKGEASSSWRVAPPPRKRFAAHAHPNTSWP